MNEKEKVLAYRGILAGQALDRYFTKHDLMAHREALEGMSRHRADRLKHDALALCGHPGWSLSFTRWSQDAWKFLALFCD